MLGPLSEASDGSKAGRQPAALVRKNQPDLALGIWTEKSNPVRLGQTESNLVKPSQTTFFGNQPAVAEMGGGKMEGGR
jgi:hypothetical protein